MQRWNQPEQKRFFIISLLTLVTAMALTVPAVSHCSTKRQSVQILAINDFHGQVTDTVKVSNRPAGSGPVLASYLREASKGQEYATFIVHAGDFVGASPPTSALLQDEPAIMFFNQLANKRCSSDDRMDPKCNLVGTLGNHEFDEGQDELLRLTQGDNHANGPFLEKPWRGAVFPSICANVIRTSDGNPLMAPHVVKKVGNLSIGFVGAVLMDTPSIVTASGIAGLSFIDEAEAINKQVDLLKRTGVKTIVVLLHNGGSQTSYEGPTNPAASGLTGEVVDIIKALDSEVDVVITGHSHSFTNALVKNSKGAEILVTQAWSKGSAFADIDLEVDTRTKNVVKKTARIVTTWADAGAGLTPDSQAAALVADAKAATEPLTGQVIAQAATELTRTQNSTGESALGNLIADAQRIKMGTDFAFMNPGGIRADLAAGEVTWGELYTVQPFNNYLVKMSLTGQQIYDLLNQQFPPNQSSSRMLQVSGLSYTWDNAGPDNDKIREVRKNGTPIDRAARYTLTVNSFLADGGDKFSTLLKGTDLVVGPIDLDALIEYVQDLPQPFTATTEGRIVREN